MANSVTPTGSNPAGTWPGVVPSTQPLLQDLLWGILKNAGSKMGKPPQGGAYTLPGAPGIPTPPVAPAPPVLPAQPPPQPRTAPLRTAAAALAGPGGAVSAPSDKLPPATIVEKPEVTPPPEIPYGGLPGEIPPEPDVAGRVTKAYEQAYPDNLEDLVPRQARPTNFMSDMITNMAMAAAGQDPVAYRRSQQQEDEGRWKQAVDYKLQKAKGQYDMELKKADFDLQKWERGRQDAKELLTQQYNADPERAMKSEKWVSDFARVHMPGATPEQIKDYVNARKDPKTGQLVGPRTEGEKWADAAYQKYIAIKQTGLFDDETAHALSLGIQGYDSIDQKFKTERLAIMKMPDGPAKTKKLDQLNESQSDYIEATKGARNKDLLAANKAAATAQASYYRSMKDMADAQLKQWKAPPISAQILAMADPSIKDPSMGPLAAQTYMKGAQTATQKIYKMSIGKLNVNKEIFSPSEHESIYTMGKGARMWLIQDMMKSPLPPAEKKRLWTQLHWPQSDLDYYKLSQKDKNMYLAEAQYAYQLLQEPDAKPEEVIKGTINYGMQLRGLPPAY
jgi:hypothetical protein